MGKQRNLSFSWKPARFLVLSLTLSFSFVLLSFFSFWAMRSLPPNSIHQESFFLLNIPSFTLSLNRLNLRSFTAHDTNLTHTQLGKPHNSSVFVANISISEKVVLVTNKIQGSGFRNFSVEGVNDLSLGHAHLRKPLNSSGSIKSSISRKEKEPNSPLIFKDDQEIENKGAKNGDVSKGKWVFDESYPLYTNFSCPFIDEGFNCQVNGRHDNDYMKWRWQPHDCDIPRFNATNMLELIRGKRLVFAGDSINRNQWESLLCLLMGAVQDPSKVYETHRRRITKQRGTYSFRFVDYQCTVEFYVSHFLVHETKARIGRKRKETLRIDTIHKGSSRWKGADILIFNTGNWWSHTKTKAGINYYQEGKQVHPHLDALTAYRKALTTWASWVDTHINPHKTHVFFRSTSPAHFREGQWNTGGHCRKAQKPLDKMYTDNPDKDLISLEIIRKMKTAVTFLNVNGLSSYRIDGHPSKYGKKGSSVEDCSHWCLPGVPDAWNQLVYHQLLLNQKKNV